jgi:hypothetical protein
MPRRKKSPELVAKCEGGRHRFAPHPDDGNPHCICECTLILYTHPTDEKPEGVFALSPNWEIQKGATNGIPK